MNYSFSTFTGDGLSRSFTFGMEGQDEGYLDASNIVVTVDGVPVQFSLLASSPNTVTLVTAPASGAKGVVRRIMPKSTPYTDFSRGNAFSQDNLNDSFLQQLYITHEILDGFFPDGFYYKQNINMGGYHFTNMGPGSATGDSVNWDQLNAESVRNDEQDGRLDSLETGINVSGVAAYILWDYIATGGEDTISPPYAFNNAEVYLNSLWQNELRGAFVIVNNTIILAEPLKAGQEVVVKMGRGAATSPSGLSGPTSGRPTGVATGYCYFDTTLGKPVWAKGSVWVDSAGANA